MIRNLLVALSVVATTAGAWSEVATLRRAVRGRDEEIKYWRTAVRLVELEYEIEKGLRHAAEARLVKID